MGNDVLWWEEENRQLLSAVCRNCPEPHFQRRSGDLPHIGCCAYEPVFTLFEIYKMIAAGKTEFFLKEIYANPQNEIYDYEIVAGASIQPLFYERSSEEDESPAERYERLKRSPNTAYLAVDERLAYAVCQFFIDGKGCGLDPRFKTSICRSFICSSIEEQLTEEERKHLSAWQRAIRDEAEPFHRRHKAILEEKGWTLRNHVHGIVEYFRQVSKEAPLF
ncbi:hypothetical protein P4S83_07400 [Aneurinibacillus thermoaerophilus]|uniref:hypothetical protein n=1 Tax=Aneurinibacillus thermoaerophilus TaxID=143495 RepID=UPI002E1C8350|nr:hypothetical protein [Aneurinibacillus thermoaerophilus]MED0765657.1 hypothetical protein [Aneurinibacillus thermoaerophilus]